jgi:2-amino-4-hydroxy-6-hydroxymethyldihydropteridine diphosphokinase
MPTSSHTTAYLGLGSNLGERESNLAAAVTRIERIAGTEVVKQSQVYESKPWGKSDQPDFLNMVIEVTTRLEPHQLLRHLLHIEKELGRDREREERWGPRTIDIDLLLFGDRTLRTASLQVPHPRMWERHFVLKPLADLAPLMVSPDGVPIARLLEEPKVREQELLPHRTEKPELTGGEEPDDGAAG